MWGQEPFRQLHAEASGKWDDPDYLRANDHYYERYVISVDENSPECIRRPKRAGDEAYLYGWGPNEYQPLGDLADFEWQQLMTKVTPLTEAPIYV